MSGFGDIGGRSPTSPLHCGGGGGGGKNRAADREMRETENRGSLQVLCVGWVVKRWGGSGDIYTNYVRTGGVVVTFGFSNLQIRV